MNNKQPTIFEGKKPHFVKDINECVEKNHNEKRKPIFFLWVFSCFSCGVRKERRKAPLKSMSISIAKDKTRENRRAKKKEDSNKRQNPYSHGNLVEEQKKEQKKETPKKKPRFQETSIFLKAQSPLHPNHSDPNPNNEPQPALLKPRPFTFRVRCFALSG